MSSFQHQKSYRTDQMEESQLTDDFQHNTNRKQCKLWTQHHFLWPTSADWSTYTEKYIAYWQQDAGYAIKCEKKKSPWCVFLYRNNIQISQVSREVHVTCAMRIQCKQKLLKWDEWTAAMDEDCWKLYPTSSWFQKNLIKKKHLKLLWGDFN